MPYGEAVRSTSGDGPQESSGSSFRLIATTALPLYVTMIASSIGSTLNVALVGRHDTGSLAALAIALAVYGPATATVAPTVKGTRAD
ncbi:Na+-driven multidrug efflux pump [Nocardioides luteus]|uniref:Polysaccharide biosynthesis protein C-terminal domain-containing protein n=1 Tax=Nocardioides luteus TaxID=1844 RepID=A0ABQ5SU85_9ACTN|nr:hypothetical protein [Nocardioides luteus]MDR7309118.1 Na+-driven multidrug efflux pump [Nocardioides luteus]GGR49683.1 hypothetical protein GCM10010197_14530 [Nocardioides luteus]GLJ67524.1 hypothetical protein GCM10017579_15600 [Nocardioides luteus]